MQEAHGEVPRVVEEAFIVHRCATLSMGSESSSCRIFVTLRARLAPMREPLLKIMFGCSGNHFIVQLELGFGNSPK